MSSLLLLRHGQASFGAETYDRLSSLGEEQATVSGAFLQHQGRRFDRVIVGPLQRHDGTARGVLSMLNQQHAAEREPALAEFAEAEQVLRSAERHFGLPLQGEHAPERRAQLQHYDALIGAWAAGTARIDGAPAMSQFRNTVVHWLRRLVDAPTTGQRVLAVTSAGVIGTLVCEVLGLPDARMIEFTRMIYNASFTEIVFTPGRCSLMSFNTTSHLPFSLTSVT